MNTISLTLEKDKKSIVLIAEALSNMNRLNLLDQLKSKDEMSHRALADKLGMTSSAISFHLSSLLDTGIVDEVLGKGLKGRNKKVPTLKIDKIVIEL